MTIRIEKQKDYQIVQELTREAFWNLYVPGCDQHFIIHKSRKQQTYLTNLTFVYEEDNKILGFILGKQVTINYPNAKVKQCLSFGPLSVHPEYQSKGVGSSLVKYFINKAKQQGYKAIIIQGYPSYYKRFGFKCAKQFKIKNQDELYYAATQVLQLEEGYFSKEEKEGIFFLPKSYIVMPEQLEQFDKKFKPKRKFKTISQLCFQQSCTKMWNEEIDVQPKDARNTQQIKQ